MFISRFIASTALVAAFVPMVSAQGIKFFEGSWADAQAKADKENKHIFVDAYAVWCGPCKMLAKDVFPTKEVGDLFNEKFISVKIDVEKGEGVQFATDYNVTAMPTLFYFSPKGELVHKTLGGDSAEGLIANAKLALDPNTQLYTKVAKYRKGEKDQTFLTTLAFDLFNVGDAATGQEIFKTIWTPLTLEQRCEPSVFELAMQANSGHESDVFEYIMTNRKAFEKTNPVNYVEAYIIGAFETSMYQLALNPTLDPKTSFKPFQTSVKKHLPQKAAYYKAKLDYNFYANKDAKSAEAQKYKKIYLDKHCDDANELNSIAWEVVGTGETPAEFKTALAWAERSVKLEKNPFNLDTKAWLLHKLNRNAEAKTTAQEAIKLGVSYEMDMSGTQELIDLINAAGKK
jgi:thiol-disulfide isomerase/thioredoxin